MSSTKSQATAIERGPRRLSRDARREQLVELAEPIIAEQGFANFSLEEIADRADVTRNLLYHYFPRGRPDLVLAVAERAGRLFAEEWVTDEAIPLPERVLANTLRMIEHAMGPTNSWRIYRMARVADDPELNEIVERFVDVVITGISLNQLGTTDPPPLVRLALKGQVAFIETALDEARKTGTPREQLLVLLAQTGQAAVQAGLTASG